MRLRRAAEEVAAKPAVGELASITTGPNCSMVTVGVSTIDDFDSQTPGY